ncbi:MAG: single-stranded-DNA-specific exonuclease RecJ [Christensenellaceae bacterium]
MKYLLKHKPQVNHEKQSIQLLSDELHISFLTASLLCARGIADIKTAHAFLHPDKSQIHDPFLFCAMRDVVSTIKNVISNKGKICIYGDYDVDGTSACAVLYKTLIQMGALVECFLPNRMEHGYGLGIENIRNLKGITLLITVDCGITNVEEIAAARELGMKTIITDHHECPHVLPNADYIINPKMSGETYPYKDLCGAGVAFKLSQALIGDAAFSYIDIAAMATIADIVPLTQENRAIAKLGIDKMNEQPNAGISMLIQKSGVKKDIVDAQTVSYTLAPRINAAGRISTARIAFDLLIENNKNKLEKIAEELCELNYDRQQRQAKVVEEALSMYIGKDDEKVILLYKKDWDIGIVGLAASKIAEMYTKPTILLGETGGVYTGSARSIDGINIYDALNSQVHLYEKFGGHAGAAGLTIREENLHKLKHRLNLFMNEKYGEDFFKPLKYYDAEVKLQDINSHLIEEFDTLKPFGHKNEQIDLLIKGANVFDAKSIGGDKHAKFMLESNGSKLHSVMFGTKSIDLPRKADVVGSVSINAYDSKPQMIVNVMSFEEDLQKQFEIAQKHLKELKKVSKKDVSEYFCDREKLGSAFVILKSVSDNHISFLNIEGMAEFLLKYLNRFSIKEIAFCVTAFCEIGLLEIAKDDRIHLIINNGKHCLKSSKTFQILSNFQQNKEESAI